MVMLIAAAMGLGICVWLLAVNASSFKAKAAIGGLFAGAVLLYWAFGQPQLADFSHHRQQALLDQALEAEGIRRNEIVDGLANLAESLNAEPQARLGWLMLARGYRILNMAEESEQALLGGIKNFPKDAELLRELGRLKMAQSRYEQAVEIFNRSLALAPNEVETLQLALAAATWFGDEAAAEVYQRRLGELSAADSP